MEQPNPYVLQSILGLFDDVLVLLPLSLISEPRENSPIKFLALIDWVMMMYSFALKLFKQMTLSVVY